MRNSILSSRGRNILRYRLLESPCGSIIDIEDTIALRSGQAFLDLLKSAIYLISNNVAEGTGIGPLIVSACQSPTTGKALHRLLQQKNPIVQAFADGLLHYASEANDRELVQKLIQSGISPNSQCGTCSKQKRYEMYRLQCAIIAKADHVAMTLLESGADPKKGTHGACLRLSLECNSISLAEVILQRGGGDTALWEMSRIFSQVEAWDVISTATFYGGMAAVKILTRYHPSQIRHALENDTSNAFILAASLGNETLLQFWLKEYNVSTRSCAIALCGAAANGHTQTVELLVSHGSEVHGDHGSIYHYYKGVWYPVFCNVTALEAALGSGHLTTAKVLIAHGANANIKTSILNAILWPLFDSYDRADFQGVGDRTLQERYNRSFVGHPSKFYRYCNNSMFDERLEIVKESLESGAEPDAGTVVWLSFAGALDHLRYLIERGLSTNAVTTTHFDIFPHSRRRQRSDVTALAAALYIGNDNVVEYLLQNETNINIPAGVEGNMSPLAASVIQGRLDWTKWLISNNADPKDPIALWAAARTDDINTYNIIHSASKDRCGHSIAEYACPAASEAIRRGNMAFLRAIVAGGIRIENLSSPWQFASNVLSSTIPCDHPLFVAVKYLDLAAVKLLLGIGADPNLGGEIHRLGNDDHDFPSESVPILNRFPRNGTIDKIIPIASALIEAGADIDYQGLTTDHSPLVTAISTRRPMALIEFIIHKGALVNASSTSRHGFTTPLCEAVCSGSYQVVQLLLVNGARVSCQPQLDMNQIPRSAIQIAAHSGHLDILQLLLEALDEGSQFISQYPLALRLAQRAGHRAVTLYLQAHRAEKFRYSKCATDEVILKDCEDYREDRKYWYQFWKDKHFKTWRSIGRNIHSEDNYKYILGFYSNASSIGENIDSENDGSVPNTMATSQERHNFETTLDGDNREHDLDWQEYFDFDAAQYPEDIESNDLTTDGSQLSTFVDLWPFDDASRAYKPDNEVLSLDGLSMTQPIGASDFPRLGEQIWGIEERIDQALWEGRVFWTDEGGSKTLLSC